MSSTRHPSSCSSASSDAPSHRKGNNVDDDECDEELTTINKMHNEDDNESSTTINDDGGEKSAPFNKSPPRRCTTFSDARFFWIYLILLVLTPIGYVCYRTFLVDRLPFEASTNKNTNNNFNVAFNLDSWGKECSSPESSSKVFPEYARRLLTNNNSTIVASPEIITPYLFSPSATNQIYPNPLESSAPSHVFSTLQWSKRCVASCPKKFPPSSMPLQQTLNNIIQSNWTGAMTNNGSVQLSSYFAPFYSYLSNDTNSPLSPPPISPKLVSPVSVSTHLVGPYHCVDEDWDGEPFLANNGASIAQFHYVLTFSQWSAKEMSNASKWFALFCAPATLVLSFILLYSMRLMLRTVLVAVGLFLLTFGSFGALAYACMREEERLTISSGGAAVAFLERFALAYRYSGMAFAFISILVLFPCLIFFWQAGHNRSTTGGRRDASQKPERPSSTSGATASVILSGSSSSNLNFRIYHSISRILSYLKISVRVVVIAPSVVMIPVLNSIIFTVFIVFGMLPLWTSMVETHYNQIMNLRQSQQQPSNGSSTTTTTTFRIPSSEYDLYQIDNNSNSVTINNCNSYYNVSISGLKMMSSPVLKNNNDISNESGIIFGHFIASTVLLVFVIMLVRSMLLAIQAALLAAPSIFWLFFSTPEAPFATPISRVSSPVMSALSGSNKFSNAWKVLPGSFIWRNLLLTIEQQKKEDFELKQQYQQNGNNNISWCNTGCIGSIRRLLSSMCCSSSCCGNGNDGGRVQRMNNNNSRANRYQVSATMRNTIKNNNVSSNNGIAEARPRGSFWGTLLLISFVQTFVDDLALLAAAWMMAMRSIFLEPNASWIFSIINNIKLIERNIKQKRASTSNNKENKCPCSSGSSASCGCVGSKHRFVVYSLHFLYRMFDFFVPNPTTGFVMNRLLKWSSLCDPTTVAVGLRLTDRKLPSSLEYDDEEDSDDDDHEGDYENSNCSKTLNNTRNPNNIMSSIRKPANFDSATKLIQDGILSMRQHVVDSSSSFSSTSCALETIIGAEILVRLISYGIGAGAAFVCWFFLDPRIFSSSSSTTATTIPPFFQFFFSQSEQQLSSELAHSQIFVPLRVVPLLAAFFIAAFIAQSHISVFSSCSKSAVIAYHCFPQYSRHGRCCGRENTTTTTNDEEDEEDDESQMRESRISGRTTNLSRTGVANSIELISLFERIDGKVGVMSMKNFSPFINGGSSCCCCNSAKEDVESEDYDDENTHIAVSAI